MEERIEAAPNDIEIPYIALQNSLMDELDRLSPMTNSRCIFRVPPRLRLVCEKAYTPQIVSIGPLHHGNQALKAMEEQKMRYLQYFLDRTNLGLLHYIKKIQDKEAELRRCYSETIKLQSDEFVKIILVDAIFVIEFLFRCWYSQWPDENDCIFGEPLMVDDVRYDLLLLENQLPFFILEDLFDPDIFLISSEYSNGLHDVERLSIMFLSYFFLVDKGMYIGRTVAELETICSYKVKIQHLVGLFRMLNIPPKLKPEATRGPRAVTAPSIEELHQAGVQFKVGSSNNLFDIRFKDGILEIPKLEIVDSTELILRNVVAYEQCLLAHSYISDYVAMMDTLVDNPRDVGLLVEYGIVKNRLGGGNHELSTMINRISTGVNIMSRDYYYGTLCEDLNKYYNSPWHKRIANLRHNYFNTPWATISFIAAAFLLILTVIQTICSIISLP